MELDRITKEIEIINECLKGASSDIIKIALYNRSNILDRIAIKLKKGMPLTEAEKGAY